MTLKKDTTKCESINIYRETCKKLQNGDSENKS